MQIQPYLYFDGACEEALDFYRGAVGAAVTMLVRFRESPNPEMIPAGGAEKVMHAVMRIGDSVIMASDGRCGGKADFQGFSLSLTTADADDVRRKVAALAQGGEVRMAPEKTFYSPCFGMVTDRFGVSWMVLVPGES